MVGGTDRDVTKPMRAIPGAVANNGAEGVYAIGLPTGEVVACKIADGSSGARAVVVVAALRRLGVGAPEEPATSPVLGHGRAVDAVEPAPALTG